MQPAGGVDDQHVDRARRGGLDRVEDDRGWIGARRLADDLDADALAPALELLDGRGAECVGRGEQDALARPLERRGQLRGGRRLAGAVHPEQQHDRRLVIQVKRLGGRRQRVDQEAAEERPELSGARHRSEHHLFARAIDEVGRERRPQIGGDEELLQLFEQGVVDRAIGLEHGAEAAGENLLRALESLAQALPQPGEELHRTSAGSTMRLMTAPLAPSRGTGRPLSSKLTPPALPIVRTKGPLDTHSRTSLGGIVSSVVRPSSVRTRIQVVSVVRATRRYVDAMAPDAATGAGVTGGVGGATAAALTLGVTAGGAG